MGADLYIKKIREPIKKEWQPKFDAAVEMRNAATDPESVKSAQKLVDEAHGKLFSEGYFRDSYNSTGVLNRIGLSWWQDLEYDVTNENSDINVSADGCRRFLGKILAAGDIKPTTADELRARHAAVDDGENSPEAWHKFYVEKRQRLIAFLERAIENGGMYASC